MNETRKRLDFFYFFLFIVFGVVKFDGTFNAIQNTMEAIKHNRDMGIMNMNLIPFRTIATQGKHMLSVWTLINLMGNIASVIPLDYLLPMTYKTFRNIIHFIVISILFVLCIEIIEFVFMIGFFDVDDIILNLAGEMIGYVLCIFTRRFKEYH